jgi:hypothetical protein
MTGSLVVRVLLGVGCAVFAFYAGRRYEREEWELVAWDNGNLREANAMLREKNVAITERANESERLAHEKAQQNAKLRQSLLAHRLQLMRDRN